MKIFKEAYTIPNNVVMFYDRHLRLWTLYIKDEEGNQISNTEYTPSKADAIEMAQNIDNFVIRESLKENDMKILKEATWSPVEYDETTGEYYSRPGNEFDGIDPVEQEELNEWFQVSSYENGNRILRDIVSKVFSSANKSRLIKVATNVEPNYPYSFATTSWARQGNDYTYASIQMKVGYSELCTFYIGWENEEIVSKTNKGTGNDKLYSVAYEVIKEFNNIFTQEKANVEKITFLESVNEGLQYLENINSRKGIRAPKALTETYHINDEEVMNKVAELGKELESQGFKYVSSKDSRDYYDFYRKIEDGKGVWKAVIYNYGAAEIIDVTYEQARGIEPIDSLEQLRKDLGKMLLPNDNINEALGRDYSHIPEVKQINYSNNKNGNLLPYLNCNRFKAALEETGLEAFKIKSARLRNVSLADLKDEFGGRGMEPWRWRRDFDSSVPMGDGNEFNIFWKGEFPKVEEKLQNEKEDTSEEKEDAKLNEDVEVPTLEGPQEGPEYGLSELINAAIQYELETVNEYNTLALNARAEGFDDIANVIDEINTEENKHIGQLQELLKTISPNAQAIVAGETEASDDLVNVDVE